MTRKLVVIVTFFLLLSGCMTTGNKQLKNMDDAQVNTLIVQGQTTKDEVRASLGAPTSVNINADGSEQWTYFFRRSTMSAKNFIPVVGSLQQSTNDNDKNLVILFDQNGVVINHSFNQAQGRTTSGLIG